MIVWACLLFLPLVCFSRKITPKENAEIKKTCGRHFLDEDNSVTRWHVGRNAQLAITSDDLVDDWLSDSPKKYGARTRGKLNIRGGKPFSKNEYPWIVDVHNEGGHVCTASLISYRHILTAAHCLFIGNKNVFTPEDCQRLDKRNERIWRGRKWRIFISGGCANPEKCGGKQLYSRNVYFHTDYNECSNDNDIAIIELSADIPALVRSPICMPNGNHSVYNILKVVGSGYTTFEKGELQGPKLIEVNYSGMKRKKIVVKTPNGHGICPGDSGGPLFQADKHNRNVQIGIASSGRSCLSEYLNNTFNYDFVTDVRKYVDWICEKTGVCPIEENNLEAVPGGTDFSPIKLNE